MKPRPDAARGGTRAVTSLQNERVKLIRSLEMRKVRRETGLFVAEGASVLVTARDAGWTPRMLVYLAGSAASGIAKALLHWAQGAGAECLEVSQAVLAKLAAKDNPQTMLGVFEQRWAPEPAPDAVAKDAAWVALEGVRDPGNLGTIIRTADAAGACGIILAGRTCDPWGSACVRAAMGSIFAIPLVTKSTAELVELCKSWPGESIGTHLQGTEDYRRPYGEPTLVIMGSEGSGLSDPVLQACSILVRIPMRAGPDSLNVAVATGLMLFEVHRA